MQKIAVIDYGMGNLHSVVNAIKKVAPRDEVVITSTKSEILNADRIVFPGVGAIGDCLHAIKAQGIEQSIRDVFAKKPILAICVGMQALLEYSEESGGVDCFGLLKGQVKDLNAQDGIITNRFKVPHMGWNQVAQSPHPLWEGIADNARFYFVHSYYAQSSDPNQVAGTTAYGVECHVALTAKKLFAVQFHPEKSGEDGLTLIKNFINWSGE